MTDFNTMNGVEVLIHLLTHPEDGIFLWVLIIFGLAMIGISLYLDKHDSSIDCKPQPPEHHL
tara:strand:- start:851 stop:1036 length:186 start_codon:yes stop_codon:yes gene_type:complete